MRVVRWQVGEGTVDRLEAGDVAVTCLPEPGGLTWPATALFGSLTAEGLAAAAKAAPPGTVDPAAGTIRLNFNVYLVEAPGLVALIDAGVGAHKARHDRPAWHDRDADLLGPLAALGVAPEAVDVVVNTHLHADHVGWNTVRDGAGWRPTFPNARYVVPKLELEMLLDRAAQAPGEPILHGAFADSILPIVEGPGYEAVELPATVAPGLTLEPAPGHTPGMAVVRLATGEGDVLFMADVVHHPLQLADLDIVSNFCANPAEARSTRRGLLDAAASTGAVLAPYHFPLPVFGRLCRNGSGFDYDPLTVEGALGPMRWKSPSQTVDISER